MSGILVLNVAIDLSARSRAPLRASAHQLHVQLTGNRRRDESFPPFVKQGDLRLDLTGKECCSSALIVQPL